MMQSLLAAVVVLLLAGGAAIAQEVPRSWQPAVKATKQAPPPAHTSPASAPHLKPKPAGVLATAADLAGDALITRFTLTLSRGVEAQVYTLADPRRVVIDLPEVGFALPSAAGRTGKGLVSAYRYGLMAPTKSRVVLDLTGPVRIEAAQQKAGQGATVRLEIDLKTTDEASFVAGARAPTGPPDTLAHRPVAEDIAPRSKPRPVIVVDPGHGGIDPGAVGTTDVTEKMVVLAVARQLRSTLAAGARYDVHLTRLADTFVSLDQRLAVSRKHQADLFISIHADAFAGRGAETVRGASIYTLSDRASDEQARLYAEKENASDQMAGIANVADDERNQVRNILVDLMQRETAGFSSQFSALLATKLPTAVALAREPQRGAGFKVLKQTDVPSVLIELGYMTNSDDERLLKSADWHRQVAQSIASAVDAYFAKRTASTP